MFPKIKRIIDEKLLAKIRKRPCVICRITPSDAAHILTKGAGNPDVEWNLLPLCRQHHTIQHQYGWFKLCQEYPFLRQELYSKGFVFDGNKKLRRE